MTRLDPEHVLLSIDGATVDSERAVGILEEMEMVSSATQAKKRLGLA